MEPMKLVITAPAGKMGRLVVREALKRPADFVVVGAVGNPCRGYIGQDISAAAGGEPVGARIYASIGEIIEACDGVVDFSPVDTAMEVLAACVAHKKPLLLGTTGFTSQQEDAIKAAGKYIPLSCSPNTSKAVNLVYQLLQTITRALGDQADIDLIEMHDNQKLDAPSGTSKVMGQIIARELGVAWEESARFGRAGTGIRGEKELTYHSIRSGDLSSTHTVIFGLEGERLELTHHAYDYSTFAKGALDGILFLRDQPPGCYASAQVLGLAD